MSGATRPQVGRLMGQLAKLGITDRDERLHVLSSIVYQPVGSTNDLTRDQASVCIDTLESVAANADPAAYLAKLTESADRYFAGVAT